jgi:hypothetical protein
MLDYPFKYNLWHITLLKWNPCAHFFFNVAGFAHFPRRLALPSKRNIHRLKYFKREMCNICHISKEQC